ncbi:MAG: 50S ribosomal protein L25 [Pseudomonadales bacterium]|nr:50S ribosomal protein L25 [Pseudomonadales bacterium]
MTNTSDKIVFHVSTRHKLGTGNVSRLRKEGKIPGNIYGLKEKSQSIVVDYKGLKKLYEDQGDTGLIFLQIDDEKKQTPVLIHEVEHVKIGEGILHVSFKRVNLNVKIEAEIPVEMIGETKIDDATVSMVKDSVLVEALPADLPDNFEVDISVLTEVGQSISLADLVFDKSKVTLVLGEDEDLSEVLLVNVQAIKEEVEEEVPTESEVNVGSGEAETIDKTEDNNSSKEDAENSDKKSE